MKINFLYKALMPIKVLFFVIPMVLVFSSQSMGGMFSPLPYRSLAPFYGKVIDIDTKKPISGAVVLAVYYGTRYTIAGEDSYIVDGRETLTDENGEFRLPRERRWFVKYRGYPKARLIIFKPGYGVFPDHRRSEAMGANKLWPAPGRYLVCKIPKLKTQKERRLNLPGAFSFKEIPYENQKMFIGAINEESINLGLTPYPIPEKGDQK